MNQAAFLTPIVVVDRISPTHFVVRSSPWPVAVVEVRQVDGVWRCKLLSETVPRISTFADMTVALESAGKFANRRAYYVYRQLLNGQQRYAVGQQQCPYWAGSRVCGQTPATGTIWCPWHPNGTPKTEGPTRGKKRRDVE